MTMLTDIWALVFDVFGTVVDWRSGVAREAAPFLQRHGAAAADPLAFADAWRRRYSPAMEEVRSGRRPFVRLDVLHRENLDAALPEFGIDPVMVPAAELAELTLAWHRLDPWPALLPLPPGGRGRARAARPGEGWPWPRQRTLTRSRFASPTSPASGRGNWQLTVSRLGIGSAEVGGIALADGRIAVDRIDLGFSPWTLIREGHLTSIELSGVSIRIGITAEGALDLPRMALLTEPSQGGGAGFPIPFQTISVRDSVIILDTPYGPIRTPVEAEGAVNDQGRLVWKGRLAPTGAGGAATAQFDLTNTPQGQVWGGAQLEQASFRSTQVGLDGVGGWIAYGGERDTSGKIEGALSIGEVERGATRLRNVALQGNGTLQRVERLLLTADIGTGAGDGNLWLQVQGTANGPGTDLTLQINANNLAAVAPAFGFEGGIAGKATLSAAVTVRNPGLPSLSDLSALQADGGIQLSTDGLETGDAMALQTGRFNAAVDLKDGVLTLAGRNVWKVVGRFASGKLAVDLDWSRGASGPQRLVFRRTDDAWWTSLAGATKGNVAGFDVSGSVDAALGMTDSGQALVRVPEAVLDLDPFQAIGLTVDPGPMTVSGETTAEGWTATLAGSSTIGLPGKAGGNATAHGAVRVDSVLGHLTVRPEGCLGVDVPAQDFTPRLRLAEPAAAQLCPDGDQPLLETDLSSDLPPILRATMPAVALDLAIGAGASPTRLTATTPILSITPSQPAGSYRLTAQDGQLALPDAGLTVQGVDADIALDPGAVVPADATLTARQLSIEGNPVVPLSAKAHGRYDSGTAILSIDADVTDPQGRARATATGRHDLATGDGAIDLALDPIRFRKRGLQPKDVIPALASVPLTCVDARLEGGGRIAWGEGEGTAIGFRLRDAGFRTPWGRAEGAAADLRLDRLAPLRLPAGQHATVGRFILDDKTPPLSDLDARFGWDRAGGVGLQQMAVDWSGAKIRVDGLRMAGGRRGAPAVLRIDGLDLARALAVAGIDGVVATGMVDGTVPFRFIGDAVVVENGVLATRGPGEIRYAADAAPQEVKAAAAQPGMDTLMAALQNFQYQSLRATLDGRSDGEARVKLAVRGANPDLYGGFPIALNVDLSGALYVIARRSMALAQIGDRVRDYYAQRLGRRTAPPC
jgi:hypothetical protein